MVPFKFMLLSAVLAAVLAAIGVTAVMAVINPSATEIAQTSQTDPMVPPDFYGRR